VLVQHFIASILLPLGKKDEWGNEFLYLIIAPILVNIIGPFLFSRAFDRLRKVLDTRSIGMVVNFRMGSLLTK